VSRALDYLRSCFLVEIAIARLWKRKYARFGKSNGERSGCTARRGELELAGAGA
jgi:hypothetical protein